MRFAILLCGLVLVPAAAQAERLYRAEVTILTTAGTADKFHVDGTENGVSRAECELRRDWWMERHGKDFETLAASLRKEGKQAGVRADCVER